MKLALLAWIWISALTIAGHAAEDRKKMVFSFEFITSGGGLRRSDDSDVGDYIRIYERENGWLTVERHVAWHGGSGPERKAEDEFFGGGPEFTKRMRTMFRETAISDLDYPAAITEAQKKYTAATKGILANNGLPAVRVFCEIEGSTFSFDSEMFIPETEYYAPFDVRFKKLKLLFDTIMLEYGRYRIFRNE